MIFFIDFPPAVSFYFLFVQHMDHFSPLPFILLICCDIGKKNDVLLVDDQLGKQAKTLRSTKRKIVM